MSNARSLANLLTSGKIYGTKLMAAADLPVLTVTASDSATAVTGLTTTTGTTSTQSTTDVVAATITVVKFTGTMRFKASHLNNGFANSIMAVYKNNSLVQSYTTNSASAVARSNDITVVPGDVIQWRHKVSNASTASEVSNITVTASDSYVTAPAYKKNSE